MLSRTAIANVLQGLSTLEVAANTVRSFDLRRGFIPYFD